MNAQTNTENMALAMLDRTPTGRDLILQADNLNAMVRVSDLMAKSRNMVPKHLRENPGGCLAVTMQAMRWNMDPFALAVKTYTVSADAPVAYEGQAIIAALNNSPLLINRLNFEWFGPWEKIIGKFKEVTSKSKTDDAGDPKKFIVPDWDINDEQGLGVRVKATIVGETEPRVLELLITQVRTRNSGLWTEDPKQQIAYLAGRRWGRLHAPDVVMGVYTPDELQDAQPRYMGMVDELKPRPPATYLQSDFDKNLPTWTEVIAKGRKTSESLIAMVESKGALMTDAQKKVLSAIKLVFDVTPKAKPATVVVAPAETKPSVDSDGVVTMTYAEVAEKLNKAADLDALDAAASVIPAVADETQRSKLSAMYVARIAQFKA